MLLLLLLLVGTGCLPHPMTTTTTHQLLPDGGRGPLAKFQRELAAVRVGLVLPHRLDALPEQHEIHGRVDGLRAQNVAAGRGRSRARSQARSEVAVTRRGWGQKHRGRPPQHANEASTHLYIDQKPSTVLNVPTQVMPSNQLTGPVPARRCFFWHQNAHLHSGYPRRGFRA